MRIPIRLALASVLLWPAAARAEGMFCYQVIAGVQQRDLDLAEAFAGVDAGYARAYKETGSSRVTPLPDDSAINDPIRWSMARAECFNHPSERLEQASYLAALGQERMQDDAAIRGTGAGGVNAALQTPELRTDEGPDPSSTDKAPTPSPPTHSLLDTLMGFQADERVAHQPNADASNQAGSH